MSKYDLKTGIKILYNMELSLYTMYIMYNEIPEMIDELDFGRSVRAPKKPVLYSTDFQQEFGEVWTKCILISSIVCGLIGMLTRCTANGNYEDSILGDLGRMEDKIGNSILGGFLGMLLGLVIGLVFAVFVAYFFVGSKNEEYEERYKKECKQYEKEYKQYRSDLEDENAFLDHQKKVKSSLLKLQKQIEKQYTTTSDKLNDFYDLLRIDEKFRNIVPIGYMEEYSRLEIATTLTGKDGLYDLVLRKLDIVHFQHTFEEIADKLDTIIDNQHSIYSELCNINDSVGGMMNSLDRLVYNSYEQSELLSKINKNSKITNYLNERIAYETEYQTQMTQIAALLYN